jgi:hypothetical protein
MFDFFVFLFQVWRNRGSLVRKKKKVKLLLLLRLVMFANLGLRIGAQVLVTDLGRLNRRRAEKVDRRVRRH